MELLFVFFIGGIHFSYNFQKVIIAKRESTVIKGYVSLN